MKNLDLYLFWTYIATIIVLISVILIIFILWGHYFPRRWLNLLIIYFITTTVGLIVLLLGELFAPYSSNFYINPFFYIVYYGLIGCALFSSYLLVLEIHYKHLKLLLIVGCIGFLVLIGMFVISAILFITFDFSTYPLITYFAFECSYALGITAFVLLAIGSFKLSASDRLEQKQRKGLIVVGIFSIGITCGLVLLAISLLLVNFSVAIDPNISIFWLLWLCVVEILYLLMVRKAVSYIT